MKPIDQVSGDALDVALRLHRDLGSGLLESVYVERLAAVHAKQLLIYLRLLHQPAGLLTNFGGETLKEGVRRVANSYPSSLRVSAPPLNHSSSGA